LTRPADCPDLVVVLPSSVPEAASAASNIVALRPVGDEEPEELVAGDEE
jgi:hypothetical protein